MFSEDDLKTLLAYHPGKPVLSAYLDLPPSERGLDTVKQRLRHLLRPYEAAAGAVVERIMRYIEHEFDGSGRSLALFCCAEDDFFRSFALAVGVRSRARLLNRPYVKPLAALLEDFGHVGVAVVDQQHARFFHFHLGEQIAQMEIQGEPIRRVKHGGGSQEAGRKGIAGGQLPSAKTASARNLRAAAQGGAQFFNRQKVRRLLIGASEATAGRFLKALPKRWQSLVLGTFTVESDASAAQILERAMEVLQRSEQEREERLVEQLITSAAKGESAVIGLDDTLQAASGGQVRTLVFEDGFRSRGWRCPSCGFLTAESTAHCPFCGSDMRQVEDAVEFAVRKVLIDGGEVEVVPKMQPLAQAGHVGALLRF